MKQEEEPRPISRRVVFYISGYDPRGAAHYHGLYKAEANKQALINGLAINVGPRRKIDDVESAWALTTERTSVEYRFLRYDDIMRARWSKTTFAVLHDIVRYTGAYLKRGLFPAVFRLSRPFFVTAAYGTFLLLAALACGIIAFAIAAFFLPWPIALAVGLGIVAGCFAFRRKAEPYTNGFWLARIMAFVGDQGDGGAIDMETRTDDFARRIAAAMSDASIDEVLVVGHSVGAHVAASAVARAFAQASDPAARASLLTLGHIIPLLGLQPGAERFRAELETLAHEPRLVWVDFSAVSDGACFALTDPLVACGMPQPDPSQPVPKVLSARYHKLFRPESYAAIRHDFNRKHFQYLMAGEIAGDYDYFLITAGDQPLGQRYAHLASLAGRANAGAA